MPGLVIKYSQKLGNMTIETLRKRFRAKYGGPERAGNVLVLDEGADLTVAGSTLEQLQFAAVSAAGEKRVCAAGGPGLLTILGFQAGDYTTAIREFADLWARPAWRQCCAALEHLCGGPAANPQVPVRLWYDVSGIAALREGELVRSQSYLVRAQAVASTIQAGMTRVSAIAAAAAADISLLVEDPNAPTPGMAGRVTETEKAQPGQPLAGPQGQQGSSPAGQGGQPQPATGAPSGGLRGRPPQAGRPQQLAGVTAPNLPNALPASAAAPPALPNGARGGQNGLSTKRHQDEETEWSWPYPLEGHEPSAD
jgi:hypothetical protein